MTISRIFTLRNFVKKQLIKTNDQGIMTLPDKGQIDFGEMIIRENLFKRGINVNSVTSEKQLESILNTPIPTPPPQKSADVLDLKGKKIDTDKPISGGKNIDWEAVEKTDIEDFAQGGRTGLSYLLAEDSNQRVPFSKGKIADLARRGFLKAAGAGAATVGAVKTGLFGLLKGGGKQAAKDLTQVPIGNPEGMPSWFKPLVNRVIKEGDDVTKKFATKEREIVHTKKIDDVDEVTVYQDLDTGNVTVEYGNHLTDNTGKVIRASNDPEVIHLSYKASEEIPLKGGKGSTKTKEEFSAVESEPEITNWDGDIEMSGVNEVNKVDDLITDTSKLKKYATGEKLTIKELSESMKKQKYKNKLETDPTEQINYIENKEGYQAMDYIDESERVGAFKNTGPETKGMNLPQKKASGGRVPLAEGKTPAIHDVISPDWDDMNHDEWLHIIKLLKSGEIGAAEGGRIPFSKGKGVMSLLELIQKLFPGTTKLGQTSRPMAEKTQLKKAIADFQERQNIAKIRETIKADEKALIKLQKEFNKKYGPGSKQWESNKPMSDALYKQNVEEGKKLSDIENRILENRIKINDPPTKDDYKYYSEQLDVPDADYYPVKGNETLAELEAMVKKADADDIAEQKYWKKIFDAEDAAKKEAIVVDDDIGVADDVGSAMAEWARKNDPEGYAKIQKVVDEANQQLELQRFKTKGRKPNASGGLANMLGE